MQLRLNVQRKLDEFMKSPLFMQKGSEQEIHEAINLGVCYYLENYATFLSNLTDWEEEFPFLEELTFEERRRLWRYDYLCDFLDTLEEQGLERARHDLEFLKFLDELDESENKHQIALRDLKLLWHNQVFGKNEAYRIYLQLSGDVFEEEEVEKHYLLSLLRYIDHLCTKYNENIFLSQGHIHSLMHSKSLATLVETEQQAGLKGVIQALKNISEQFFTHQPYRAGFTSRPHLVSAHTSSD